MPPPPVPLPSAAGHRPRPPLLSGTQPQPSLPLFLLLCQLGLLGILVLAKFHHLLAQRRLEVPVLGERRRKRRRRVNPLRLALGPAPRPRPLRANGFAPAVAVSSLPSGQRPARTKVCIVPPDAPGRSVSHVSQALLPALRPCLLSSHSRRMTLRLAVTQRGRLSEWQLVPEPSMGS